MTHSFIAKRLEISGVVQGVGFRPFLYALAHQYGLKGEVSNTLSGVRVILQGGSENIAGFVRDIDEKKPLLAFISRIEMFDQNPGDFSSFKIVESRVAGPRVTLISPDVTVCEDCLREMQNPLDRRFEYPFINCTNCGPRYTIIEDIPYDRPKTSMKTFLMCDECRAEYNDPKNRRFHAQPNACPACGPEVFLTDTRGHRLSVDSADAIALAARYLKEGHIVAVKGLGGFHLSCDASQDRAVTALRQRKKRPHKPFALMAASDSVIFDHVDVSEAEKALLYSYHRPIVLLKKKRAVNQVESQGLSNQIAPFNRCLGIMLPYTPLHHLLLQKGPPVLVMTSGNRSGEPLSITHEDALSAFSHIADYFLFHTRDIYFRADDSITRIQAGRQRFLRRSRGYAPLPLMLNQDMPRVLACGAGLKNTVCLTRGREVFLSQHIGDLFNIKTYDFFKTSIEHLKKILDIEPQMIVHDLHPGYMSTAYAAEQQGIRKIGVQHHHAHAVACMAENDLDEAVLAITLDGTGYGTDGTIWGGEILWCTRREFVRKAHLSCIRMPGGDAAVLEPWRMAASVLYEAFGSDFLSLPIPYLKEMNKDKLVFIIQMMEKNLNSPLTSSCGRLIDAVASILCICHQITHESQAAMELEDLADDMLPGETYRYRIREKNDASGCLELDLLPGIRDMVSDLETGAATGTISAKFHLALVHAFAQAFHRISRENGIKKAVLSGGVFNNDIILNQMIACLEADGCEVYTHSRVPCGDGGLCLGQAAVAAALEEY